MRPFAVGLLVILVGCGANSHGAVPDPSRTPAGPASTGSTRTKETPFTPRRVTATTLRWKLTLPTARQAVVDSGSGEAVLAGGMLAGDASTPRTFGLDPSHGRSHELSPLEVAVHDAAGGFYAGRPAVFGGGNATEQSVVQAYRGSRWRMVDSLPTTRSDLAVARVGGRTLVLGGYDGSRVPRVVLVQRGGGGLQQAGRLLVGVRYAAVAAVGSAVYVFGGEVSGHELGVIQRFDPRTGVTRGVGRLPHPLGHAMTAVFGTRVLVMGGRLNAGTQTSQTWWFDPATGRVSKAGRLPRPLSDAAVVRRGHSAFLLGGEDPGVTDRVVRIDVR